MRAFQLLVLVSTLVSRGSGFVVAPGRIAAPASLHMMRAASVVAREREILQIANQEEYECLLEEAAAQNRVVVIKFYASWCRACKAMAPKLARIANDFPQIEFHQILFDNNKVSLGMFLRCSELCMVCNEKVQRPDASPVQMVCRNSAKV